MADTILKLIEIEDLFAQITRNMIGNQAEVRISWPTGGAPAWKITDNIVFLQVNDSDDPIVQQRDITFSQKDQNNAYRKIGYTKFHTVLYRIYGPNSYDNAETIRNALFLPEYKEEFANKNLFLIPVVSVPRRFPELFNGQWWQRADFQASFNEGVERETTVPYINSTDIQIKKG